MQTAKTAIETERAWITARKEYMYGASILTNLFANTAAYKGILSANISGPEGTEEDAVTWTFPIVGTEQIEYLQETSAQEARSALEGLDDQLRQWGFESCGNYGSFWFQREYWRPYINSTMDLDDLNRILAQYPHNAYALACRGHLERIRFMVLAGRPGETAHEADRLLRRQAIMQVRQARDDLEEALRLNPRCYLARLEKAKWWIEVAKYMEAKYWEEGKEWEATAVKAWERAAEACKILLRLDPQDETALAVLDEIPKKYRPALPHGK